MYQGRVFCSNYPDFSKNCISNNYEHIVRSFFLFLFFYFCLCVPTVVVLVGEHKPLSGV